MPSVKCVYFVQSDYQHNLADIQSSVLWSTIFDLAGQRCEYDDCARGLLLAIEVMAGNMHRHQRLVQRNPQRAAADLNRAPNIPRLFNVTRTQSRSTGGPRFGPPVIGPPAGMDAFPNGQDPEAEQYRGDSYSNNPENNYALAAWQYIHLDCYNHLVVTFAYTTQSLVVFTILRYQQETISNDIKHYRYPRLRHCKHCRVIHHGFRSTHRCCNSCQHKFQHYWFHHR